MKDPTELGPGIYEIARILDLSQDLSEFENKEFDLMTSH